MFDICISYILFLICTADLYIRDFIQNLGQFLETYLYKSSHSQNENEIQWVDLGLKKGWFGVNHPTLKFGPTLTF